MSILSSSLQQSKLLEESLSARIKNIEEENSSLSSSFTQLSSEVDSLRDQNSSHTDQSSTYESTIDGLRKEVENRDEQAGENESTIDELRLEVTDLTSNIKQKEKEAEDKDVEVEQSRLQVLKIQKESKMRIAQLTTDYHSASTTISALQNEIGEQQGTIDDLEESIVNLKGDYNEKQQREIEKKKQVFLLSKILYFSVLTS